MRRALARLLRRVADVADPPEQAVLGAETQPGESHTDGDDRNAAQRAPYSVSIEIKIPQSLVHAYGVHQAKSRRPLWWQAGIGALTLIVVGVYTFVSHRQWQEMRLSGEVSREAVDISRKALDSNERAWLVGNVTKFVLADQKQLPAFSFDFKNAGKSPAWGIRQIIACEFSATRPNLFPNPWPEELTIPPADTRERRLKCWNTSTEDAAQMFKGREFWIWVLTLYKDPFAGGKDRLSLEWLGATTHV